MPPRKLPRSREGIGVKPRLFATLSLLSIHFRVRATLDCPDGVHRETVRVLAHRYLKHSPDGNGGRIDWGLDYRLRREEDVVVQVNLCALNT
jgi:hypothetical protein